MLEDKDNVLQLAFHGKIIDHLGVQMYQSPIASIAELVSNAWDANAKNVQITLPEAMSNSAAIVVKDDGDGMTLDDCQNKYLNIGYNRREHSDVSRKRPVMGRKGIGKFAGFGIANKIKINTISKQTGERTVFVLDLEQIRKGDTYVNTSPLKLTPELIEEPNEERKKDHGTVITLLDLTFERKPGKDIFIRGLSRRFAINSTADNFKVFVNDTEVKEEDDSSRIEFSFPRDYKKDEIPDGLITKDGYGVETINGQEIRWKINFYKDTIQEPDFQGISVFAHKKLAQTPFMFNLSGGLPSQTGPEYLSGKVIADFVDELSTDVISPERQRLNWEHTELKPLEAWGQEKIKDLLKIWKKRHQEEREKIIREKIGNFGQRLSKLPSHEQKVIETDLKKLAALPKLTTEQFTEMGEAILIAWEGGRLKALITEMANVQNMTEEQLLKILFEANVLTALHTAEAVKTKLEAIEGLRQRIKKKDLENAVRNYIAESPWLISPRWETFVIERSIDRIIKESLKIAKIEGVEDWKKRVDLVLSSGNSLLILEFMRPGLKIDYDHVSRFQYYINSIKSSISAQTGLEFDVNNVYGYLIADKIEKSDQALLTTIQQYKKENMLVMDWNTLLSNAEVQWKEFLDILIDRAPEDHRIQSLKEDESKEDSIKETSLSFPPAS